MPEADGRRARAYLRRNPTFPLDVEPWGGRRCAALPRYVECPATTVAYAIPTLGPGAAVRPKSPCASCAALLWQTAPRRAICGSDRPFSALRDHFVRTFQQPASECENDALSVCILRVNLSQSESTMRLYSITEQAAYMYSIAELVKCTVLAS